FVAGTLVGPWARFRIGATALRQVQVPNVLPLPDERGNFAHSPEERAQLVRRHLRRAGLSRDAGRHVVWVMPRDAEWDAIFRHAIRAETGFGPFVAQRWFDQCGQRVRGALRVIDTDMLLRGLET